MKVCAITDGFTSMNVDRTPKLTMVMIVSMSWVAPTTANPARVSRL
jgi:hypothetical protein